MDWPLGLCSLSTIDPAADLEARDLVDHNGYVETYRVHRNHKQDWYFVSGQTNSEAWVFLQSDSKPDRSGSDMRSMGERLTVAYLCCRCPSLRVSHANYPTGRSSEREY